jgi:ferric-dicitrate binding protein FerR (iron transport regulator)
MTENVPDHSDDKVDPEIDRMLKNTLPANHLGPEALERVRSVAEQEWRALMARRQRLNRRRWALTGMAAAAVLVAVTGIWFVRPATAPVLFGSVYRADAGIDKRGTLLGHRTLVGHRTLRAGDLVHAGDELMVGSGPALIAIAGGGTLRIAARSAVDIMSSGEVRLEHGTIYVDMPPLPAVSASIAVSTKAGVIEHVGTEFEVMSDASSVRIRVREGRIRLRGAPDARGQVSVVSADAGTEVVATVGGPILQRRVATYGTDWLWLAELAPGFEIEGQPLMTFLQWVSRELGRRLEFADAQARETATRTILHGTIRERSPLDALSNVLETTSLSYELRGDTILVNSQR